MYTIEDHKELADISYANKLIPARYIKREHNRKIFNRLVCISDFVCGIIEEEQLRFYLS